MNLSDSDGRTALHAATEKKQAAVIEFLIDQCKVSPFVRWRYAFIQMFLYLVGGY